MNSSCCQREYFFATVLEGQKHVEELKNDDHMEQVGCQVGYADKVEIMFHWLIAQDSACRLNQ